MGKSENNENNIILILVSFCFLLIISNIVILVRYTRNYKTLLQANKKILQNKNNIKKMAFREIERYGRENKAWVYIEKAFEAYISKKYPLSLLYIDSSLQFYEIPIAYYLKATVFLEQKKYKEAKENFEFYQKYVFASPYSCYNIAVIQLQQKKRRLAIENLKKAIFFDKEEGFFAAQKLLKSLEREKNKK